MPVGKLWASSLFCLNINYMYHSSLSLILFRRHKYTYNRKTFRLILYIYGVHRKEGNKRMINLKDNFHRQII